MPRLRFQLHNEKVSFLMSDRVRSYFYFMVDCERKNVAVTLNRIMSDLSDFSQLYLLSLLSRIFFFRLFPAQIFVRFVHLFAYSVCAHCAPVSQ